MWHSVNAEDFAESGKVMKGLEERGVWFVCDEYEINRGAVVAKYPYPVGDPGDSEIRWGPYMPLEFAPHLFLSFSRLHEEGEFEESVLAWSNKYGVIGGDRFGRLSESGRVPIARFREEAKRAWVVIRLYESALNSDAQAVQSLLHRYRDDQLIQALLAEYRKSALFIAVSSESPDEEIPGHHLLPFALYEAVRVVNRTVRTYCHRELVPTMTFRKGGRLLADPTGTVGKWIFSDLLGAMYLQMYWLIEAGDKLTRCGHCGRVISLARPHPKGRKPRNDMRYCDDACRQAYHRAKKKGVTSA
jgi:hypothetical protein